MTWILAAALLIVASAGSATAQPGGQLNGTVYDQTGAAMPTVTISLRGPVSRKSVTDESGRFVFQRLPDGRYECSASSPGFQPATRTVEIRAGDVRELSFTLVVGAVEHTIVTAAKTGADAAQSIPGAISALPGSELTRLAIRSVDEAVTRMPSVTFSQNSTFGQLSIRGIGSNAVNAGTDPSSAIYLDGVYLARPAMVFIDFLDLDRVEVLRGPQGTLYGRNALGGALNLISKVPTNDFELSGRATVGNLDERRVEGRVSGALKRDRLMASLAFARGARTGYVRDLDHPDDPLGGDDLTSARGQVRLVVNRRTDVLVSADSSDQAGRLLQFNKILQVKPGFTVDDPPGFRDVRTSLVASSDITQSGAAIRVTSSLTPSTTLVSLTAFRTVDNAFTTDGDITELDVLAVRVHERQHQWSEEVTLSGRRSRGNWVVGLFLFDEFDHHSIWADQLLSRVQVQLDPRVDAQAGALFGEGTIRLSSRLSGTFGLRYSREHKRIDNIGAVVGLDPPMAPVPGTTYAYVDSIEHSAWSPKIAAQWQVRPDVMTYVSATRGFKSGGFNLSSPQPGRGFAPEFAWNYEAGVKSSLLKGRARVSLAAFHMDYKDLQVQTPIGVGVFDIRNAAAATIQGLELEATSRIVAGLDVGGHLAWLDAVYDRYTAVGIGGQIGDVAGRRLNNAPEWSGRFWAEWTRNIGAANRLSLTADITAQSTVFYTPFNDDVQRQTPYALLGARAEYGPAHRRWAVNAYARNLTDTDYITATFATAPTAFGGRPGPPRQIGLQLLIRR